MDDATQKYPHPWQPPCFSWLLLACLPSLFLSFFFNLATSHSLWELSSLTRDQAQAPAKKASSPNHWTTREFPALCFSFPSQPIPPNSPFPSFILTLSVCVTVLLSALWSEKTISLREAAILLLLQSQEWLHCFALTIIVTGREERSGPVFSPHSPPGRLCKVTPVAPEMKPAFTTSGGICRLEVVLQIV